MKTTNCWSAVAALSAVMACGCAVDETDSTDETEEPVPLVVIEDDTGRVEWMPPEVAGAEPEIVITGYGDAAPLIPPDLVDRIGPVQSYLALVDVDAPLPPALASFVSDADEEVLASRELRQALRDENLEIREQIELANAEIGDEPVTYAGGCSAAQASSARNFYGAAYSAGGGSAGSKTCGQHISNFHSVDGTTYYCNIAGADCDYELGGGAGGQCDPDGCTTVRGRTRALRARKQLGAGGNYWFAHYGKRYRFGFKNCSSTYSAVMRRRRGSGSWIHTEIAPGAMQVRVGGGAYPPPYALVRNFVAWGLWEEHHNWGTSADPLNKVEMVAQTEGFLCADIIQRFDTYDYATGWCNGGKGLCDDDSCSGSGAESGCWD